MVSPGVAASGGVTPRPTVRRTREKPADTPRGATHRDSPGNAVTTAARFQPPMRGASACRLDPDTIPHP
jgi:hypothetical protein